MTCRLTSFHQTDQGAVRRRARQPVGRDEERRDPSIRDFSMHSGRSTGKIPGIYKPRIPPLRKFQSMPLPRAGAVCCGSGATAGCYYSYGDGRIHALAGCEQLANVQAQMPPGCCGRQRSVAGYTASSLQATQASPSSCPAGRVRGSGEPGSGAGISFSRSARSPIRRCGSATTASGRCDTINTHAGAR